MELFDLKNIIYNNIYKDLYEKIKKKKLNKKRWLTIIIPVKGRLDFIDITLRHLKNSITLTDKNINIVVIEHSHNSEYKDICKGNNVDYFFIKSENDNFNKSLCHNVGSLLFKNSEHFLFHDLDCLVKEDFIVNIIKNKNEKNVSCLQTFDKRRVLYLSEEQTKNVLEGDINIDTINDNDLEEGLCCAPGGSIFIERDLFFNVGGYDPELFYNWSPEDLFFWDKVEFLEKIGICDSPKNEIYHMFHKPQNMGSYENKKNMYDSIKEEYLGEIIKIKKEIIEKYI